MPYLDYVPSIRDAGKEDDRYLQITAAYHQCATFLKMLEYVMGKDNFYQALRNYTSTYRKNGTKLQLLVKQGNEAPYEIKIDY
jgi:hypothetical protein